MPKKLRQLDYEILHFINSHNSTWADKMMTLVSGQILWLPFFILIIILLFRVPKPLRAILILVSAVAIADLTSVHLFKNVFERLRPCHNQSLPFTLHLINNYCGGKYGFISSHASNFFAIASFSSFVIKKKWFTILSFSIAILVIYSRVYLGVHYPSDVLGGAIWGFLLGFVFFKLYLLTLKQKNN